MASWHRLLSTSLPQCSGGKCHGRVIPRLKPHTVTSLMCLNDNTVCHLNMHACRLLLSADAGLLHVATTNAAPHVSHPLQLGC